MDEKSTEAVLEIIREFANVGAGNAATARASLLDMELVNEVTSCKILPFSEVGMWLGGSEEVVAGTYTQLCGDLRGGVLVVFPTKSAITIVEHLAGERANMADLSPIQVSALCEVGNICLCWYLVAVSDDRHRPDTGSTGSGSRPSRGCARHTTGLSRSLCGHSDCRSYSLQGN
jgi:chemotaxis protein CheY-P-specific phosphatase CheC